MNSIENEKLQQMNTSNGGYRLKEAVKTMIKYAKPILREFPREEKYGLAKRIKDTMYDMQHLCNEIQTKYYKKDTLVYGVFIIIARKNTQKPLQSW